MGSLTLKNRIVMAPMSRCRAPKDTLVIPDYMVEYFEQRYFIICLFFTRASAGLIITECCPISKRCGSWVGNGGIYTDD